MLDLATRDNWELILAEIHNVQYIRGTTAANRTRYYEPIAPIYSSPSSNLLLVGTKSDRVKPHWFLGAIASQFLYVSPSMFPYGVSGVQSQVQQKLGLNRLTLVQFPDYGISPYVLELQIPHWIEDITIEVWQYNLPLINELNQLTTKVDVIQAEVGQIRQLIALNENYGT